MLGVGRSDVFNDWFERLRDENAQARIARRIDRLQAGNPGDIKPVGNGVSELQIDYGPGYRLYTGRLGNRVIVRLCGGDKSSQQRDIVAARRLLRDIESGVTKWSK